MKQTRSTPAALPPDAPFRDRVHAAIRAVPRGRVASYGGIAAIIGQPRAARAVGTTLCNLPEGSDVPWWRVINRNGEISIKCSVHGPALQRALLRREGVRFDRNDRVDWDRFGWDGSGLPRGVRGDDEADRPIAAAARKRTRRPPPAAASTRGPGRSPSGRSAPSSPARKKTTARATRS